MKKTCKIFAVLLVIAVALFGFSVTASAAETSNTQDGLTATITTEKDSYQANEDIELTFKVTNTNDFAVDNVSLEAFIPDGLTLKSNSDTSVNTVSLGSGESLELTLTAVKESSATPPSTDNDTNPTTQPQPEAEQTTTVQTDIIQDATSKVNTASGDSTKSTSDDNTKNTDNGSVSTGSNIKYILPALVALISLFVLLFYFKKHRSNLKMSQSILALVLCVSITASSVLSITIPTFAAVNEYKFDVSKTVLADGNEYAINAVIKYDKNTSENDFIVTRGQWVDMLANKFSMNKDDVDKVDSYFTDIDNNQYRDSIVTAYYNAVLPVDSTEFNPNNAATRDFAAFTLNNCICFVKNEDLSCDDYDDIVYKDSASALVERGYFSLINNKFMPNKPVTKNEMDSIILLIQESLKEFEIDPEHENVIDVKDDVLDFNENIIKSINGNTVVVTLNDDTAKLTSGSIFIAPDPENNGSFVTYKVENVATTESGELKLTVSEPELSEVYNKISVQGVVDSNKNDKDLSPVGANTGTDNSVGGNWFELHKTGNYYIDASKLQFDKTYKIKNDDGDTIEVTLNGGLNNPVIEYAVDFNVFDLDNFKVYVALKNELAFHGEAEVTLGEGSGTLEIAKVPVPLCPGVNVNIIVNLVVKADGTVIVDYSLENTVGMMITKENGAQLKKDFGKSNLELKAQVNLSVGIAPGLSLSVGSNELVEVFAEIGVKGSVDVKTLKDNLIHTNLKGHLFFDINYEIKVNDFTKKIFESINVKTKDTFEVINESNSPVKIALHFEGTNLVDECTYRYISGVVKANDFPVSGATISVYDGTAPILVDKHTTNDFGEFGFVIPAPVLDQKYSEKLTVKIEKDGYAELEKTVTVETGKDTDLGTLELTESSGLEDPDDDYKDDKNTHSSDVIQKYGKNVYYCSSYGSPEIMNLPRLDFSNTDLGYKELPISFNGGVQSFIIYDGYIYCIAEYKNNADDQGVYSSGKLYKCELSGNSYSLIANDVTNLYFEITNDKLYYNTLGKTSSENFYNSYDLKTENKTTINNNQNAGVFKLGWIFRFDETSTYYNEFDGGYYYYSNNNSGDVDTVNGERANVYYYRKDIVTGDVERIGYSYNQVTLNAASWKQLYIDYVNEMSEYYDFSLIQLNNDNIPELCLTGKYTMAGDVLCWVSNNSLQKETSLGCSGTYYIENSGLLKNSGGQQGIYFNNVFSFDGESLEQTVKGYSHEKDNNVGNTAYYFDYTINDNVVSWSEYNQAIASAFDSSNAKKVSDETYSKDEIIEIINNY